MPDSQEDRGSFNTRSDYAYIEGLSTSKSVGQNPTKECGEKKRKKKIVITVI